MQKRFTHILSALDHAEATALRYFRSTDLVAKNKEHDGFDPVTLADQEVETHLRTAIMQEFPQDSILGEEYENHIGTNGYQWVIDPIDGTRAFMIGAPSFTILIALYTPDGAGFGIISQPFTGERFIGDTQKGASHHYMDWRSLTQKPTQSHASQFQNSLVTERPLKVRLPRPLNEAVLLTTYPQIGTSSEYQAFERVAEKVRLVRYGLDAYAYALLAMGQVDLVIEAGLKPFDWAAPRLVVKAAGGVVKNWEGGNEIGPSGQIIAASCDELAREASRLLIL